MLLQVILRLETLPSHLLMLMAVTVISSGQGLHLRRGPHDTNKRVAQEYSEMY